MPLFKKPANFVYPGDTDRTAICGMTGSGKSTFALWLFSVSANFDRMPWIFIDYKGEDIIQQILKNKDAKLLDMNKPIPKEKGIYVVKPSPRDPELILDFLWKVYEAEKTGLFFDELMMLPKQFDLHNNPFQAILTQGRSKRIPCFLLTQRPARVSVSTFSEATYISEFELNKKDDRARVEEYIPDNNALFADDKPLPRYWSKWYDSKRKIALKLKPSPDAKEILDTISRRVDDMEQTRIL